MAEEATTQAVTNEVVPATTPTVAAANVPPVQDAEDVNALPGWAQKVIGELRKESAAHRKAKADAERAAQTQAEQAAKAQGEWQKLAEQYEPKAKRTDTLEKFIADMVEAELKDVPAKMQPLVPEFDDPLKKLEWLRAAKAASMFASPQAPRTDAGEGGRAEMGKAIAQQEFETQLWRDMGFTNALRAREQAQKQGR